MSKRSKQAKGTSNPPVPTAAGGSGILKRAMATMKLSITLERDETGMIVAECPAIPGW